MRAKINGFAIAAMVNGIAASVFRWTLMLFIYRILDTVLGHVSLGQYENEPMNVARIAIAGLVLVYALIGLWALIFIHAAI